MSRAWVKGNVVDPEHISTDLQKADILTERLGAVKLFRMTLLLICH